MVVRGVSTAHEGRSGTNSYCHTLNVRAVNENDKHVMRSPSVLPIFWGHYYASNSDVPKKAKELITDLVTGTYMNGLAQYGVGRGSVLSPIVVDITTPEPTSLTKLTIYNQLVDWFKKRPDGTTMVSPPAVSEQNLLYFIFLPTTAEFSGDDIKGRGGYHDSGKYNVGSDDDDLFFGAVRTNDANRTSATKFVSDTSISAVVSHELCEAFTDRDFKGFITPEATEVDGNPTCEIGDICEIRGAAPNQPLITYSYRGWEVEHYWSNWETNCIKGEQPVNLKKFLNAIGFDGTSGLRALGTARINVDFVASKM